MVRAPNARLLQDQWFVISHGLFLVETARFVADRKPYTLPFTGRLFRNTAGPSHASPGLCNKKRNVYL